MKLVILAGVATLALSGCNATTTCDFLEAAHQAFLADVAANPGSYTPERIRDEQRLYLAKSVSCSFLAPAIVK